MMQQQICQPDQMGQPQQVMLCPVRLVYETQILVQPGEQIQPNQTLFINPQNPPPWIQNRPQNQVIYMQQMPGNMVPSVPQHMDQNQMYLQNLQNYYPQQMIQMDQMRQMQNVVQMMPNINNINQITGQNNLGQSVTLNVGQSVSNMGQNVSNMGQNVSNMGQNVSLNTGQNVMPISNVVQNVNQKPNVVNTVNIAQNVNNDRYNSTNVMPNLPMVSHQNTIANATHMQDRNVNMNQNLVNMQKVAELQGMRQNRQPQVTVSPTQNVKYAPNVGDVRLSSLNVGDIRPSNSPRPMNVGNISSIPSNIVQANLLNKKVPLPNKPNPAMQNQVRHYNQTYYRHIQPKPMSVVPIQNQNQYLPLATQTLSVPNQINNDVSRKRKSDSPDDTRKKIPNMNQVNNLPAVANHNQSMTIVPNVNNKIASVVHTDVGVNTNPIQRDIKKGSPVQHKLARPIQTASTGTQANIAKEKPQIVEMKVLPPLIKDVQLESDKLIRNTVFTQARGLLRTEPHIMQPDVISIEKIETIINPINTIVMNSETVKAEATKIETPEAMKIESPIVKPMKIQTSKANEPMKTEQPKTDDFDVSIYIKIGTGRGNREPLKLETSTSRETPKEIVKQEEKPVQFKEDEKPVQLKKEERPVQLKKEEKPVQLKKEEKPVQLKKEDKPVQLKEEEPVQLQKEENPVQLKKEEEPVQLDKDVKPIKEIPDTKPEIKSEATKEVVEAKPLKKEVTEVKEANEGNKKFTVTAISDFKGNELQIADGSVRKQDTDSYILTHVLDGYVIQESNTAFPIRRPLKEKAFYHNTDLTSDQRKEETPYKHRTEDGKLIRDNSKILTISDLDLNEEDSFKSEEEKTEEKIEEKTEEEIEEKIEEKSDEDPPFASLEPSEIKTWTIDQLAEYLSKYKWTETISALSEHEIDGESLFLVSKQQLEQIGVSEEHADVICEFIKKI